MKAELQKLRKMAVIRAGINQNRVCGRCQGVLGFLINRGSFCPICRKKVCKACQFAISSEDTPKLVHEWICLVCWRQM